MQTPSSSGEKKSYSYLDFYKSWEYGQLREALQYEKTARQHTSEEISERTAAHYKAWKERMERQSKKDVK